MREVALSCLVLAAGVVSAVAAAVAVIGLCSLVLIAGGP